MAHKQNSHKREILYMATVAGTQKEISITTKAGEEVTYLLQHPGIREGVKLRGRSKDGMGNMDEEKYYEELMKRVVVQPKTNWDYWEENEGFQEVMKEASTFLVG